MLFILVCKLIFSITIKLQFNFWYNRIDCFVTRDYLRWMIGVDVCVCVWFANGAFSNTRDFYITRKINDDDAILIFYSFSPADLLAHFTRAASANLRSVESIGALSLYNNGECTNRWRDKSSPWVGGGRKSEKERGERREEEEEKEERAERWAEAGRKRDEGSDT